MKKFLTAVFILAGLLWAHAPKDEDTSGRPLFYQGTVKIQLSESAISSKDLKVLNFGEKYSEIGISSLDEIGTKIKAANPRVTHIEAKNKIEAKKLGLDRWITVDIPADADVMAAVEMYKAANPQKTPPTYGIYDNIAKTTPIVANCSKMFPVSAPFSIDKKAEFNCYGPTFNGYYATGKLHGKFFYFDKKLSKLTDFGSLLSYYDKNGLLIFDEGNSTPIRITPYSNLPEDAYKTAILPEFSKWYNTDQYIPTADVKISNTKDGISVSIKATAVTNFILKGSEMPYGVMIWGDYSKYTVGKSAPEGTKILNTDGLFIPMMLKEGENVLKIEFKI